MKTAPLVLAALLLFSTSVSSLTSNLRAAGKNEEHILTVPAPHGKSSTIGLVRGRSLVVGAEYTTDEDFDMGTSINVNHNTTDQLELDSKSTPFNFIWIPISNKNLVVKIDTDNGNITGTYRTIPTGGAGDPSRTTVDSDGSVWVANRAANPGSIVHIGLLENNQCDDRDGTPGIKTSTGGIPLDWTTTGEPRGVGDAEDECIVHYTQVSSCGTRHLSVDANNDVWVSGTGCGRPWDLVKGGRFNTPLSGKIIRHKPGWDGKGGYGGLMDSSGIIWSANQLLRWDPNEIPGTLLGTYTHDSYGLCIDSRGNVWNTALGGNSIRKFKPDGTLIASYQHGFPNAQGCVIDGNDDVWVAHSRLSGANTVGHLKNNGTFVGNVIVGSGPTGVSVDGRGKIWSANYNSGTVSRIDPLAGPVGGSGFQVGAVDLTVNLPAGSNPYNYGDMTGSTLISPPKSGTWSIIYTGEFKWLEWSSIEPSDSSLLVEARNSNFGPWTPAQNGIDLSIDTTGEYLEVRVIFTRASSGESPILYDLTVGVDKTPPEALCQDITIYLNNEGMVTVTAADIDNGSNDDSGIASMEVSQSDFECSDVGNNQVMLNVTDYYGNSAQCTSTVTVVDNVIPNALCQDISIGLDDDGQAHITAADIDVGSTDACGIAMREVSPSDFECSDVGTNQIILNVKDINGNSGQCTSTVTIIDDIIPEARCGLGPNPGGVVNGVDSNGFFTLTGNDNCPMVFYIVDGGTGFEFGPYPGNIINFKWTKAPGSDPTQNDGSGVVDYRLHGKGDASVRVEDSSGNIVEGACPITPPKKKQAKGGK